MEGGKKHHYSNLLFSHGLRFSLLFYNLESFTAAVSILTPTFACLPKTFCQQLRLQAEVLMADNPGKEKICQLDKKKLKIAPEASRHLAPGRGSQPLRCLGLSPERLTSL